MFDDQTKSTAPLEDIFAPTEPAAPAAPARASSPLRPVSAGATPPAAPARAPTPLPSPAGLSGPMGAEFMGGGQGPASHRGLLLAVMGGVVVLLLGGGAWWWFTHRTPAPAGPAAEEQPAPRAPTQGSEVAPPVSQPLDSDGDGLSDVDEQARQTDKQRPDSDDDGLFDGEEVNVYRTDPRVADSDQDGFTDGQEVHNGYNPLGAGKLLELPRQP